MTEEYLLSSTWAKRLQRFLILLLALRIISYFVLTDNIVIVQVTKASLRVFITLLLSVILFFQSRINQPQHTAKQQSKSPRFYAVLRKQNRFTNMPAEFARIGDDIPTIKPGKPAKINSKGTCNNACSHDHL